MVERRDWEAWFASPSFQQQAQLWARESLSALGFRCAEDTWQVRRLRGWSTQSTVRATSPAGDEVTIWFKAGNPGQAFEPRLLVTLAELAPRLFLTPLAVEVERGWMLTSDFGSTLYEQGVTDEDTTAVERLVARMTEAQFALVEHRDRLLASGLDEVTPELLIAAVDSLVADATVLPSDHPGHLPSAEQARVRDGVAVAGEMITTLTGGRIPYGLDHNDLHTNNAYGSAAAPQLFDLGDALWGHPFVGFAWLDEAGPEVLARSVSLFERYGSAAELEPELRVALRLQPVHRLLAWWRVMSPIVPTAWPEHSASIPHWCRRLADLAG